ncbi:TIGR03862 family flavoprotein [Aquincola sp. S2]|uniref:TIGR03862 family flavoprotein n=1 Tax=Pseudaquabacterium terrae TaxID=2732868 RepID=A0ABX2EKD0_9BURK|nr:TIGR03862 family flavoprotein [Aquabacterium terrae]NRF69022.1 TIGR03862 family flavoprotein [Aquabacterium terrae]
MDPSYNGTASCPTSPPEAAPRVAIVGAGPAGLMAAERLLAGGAQVSLHDAMPSAGRKFLLAGKGGLNLTHNEPAPAFIGRYGPRAPAVARWLEVLGPQALRDWAAGLGVSTFVGSSGRVFPHEMKAAPLLRAWLHRLRAAGLRLHMRQRWTGWQADDPPTRLRFDTPQGAELVEADAVVLALGGASWPRLGSDGAWWPWLAARGVALAPLAPANCGFDVGWSDYFSRRFAGAPMKSVRLQFDDFDRAGEFVITAGGIEGSLVYAAAAPIRERITRDGRATIHLDLLPGRSAERLAEALAHGRGARSLPNHLREQAGLDGVKAALLRERYDAAALAERVAQAPQALANELKHWPIELKAPRPVDEAISTAGGVRLEALDERLMLTALPGVFCAGEMLDWEAPTGGYLLTACFACGHVAGDGVLAWWRDRAETISG